MTSKTPDKPAQTNRSRKPVLDPARVDRVVRFGERHLKHMKAEWAGRPFTLERWQREQILAPIFGTVDSKGLRWYREAVVGLPRKNGKSELAALIALYGLLADNEPGADVFSFAGSRSQAGLVFKTAADMVRASPVLRATCKVYRSVIEVPETGSVYRVMSGPDSAGLVHGTSPHVAILDEMHVWPAGSGDELYEAVRTGVAARRQSLIVTISTAGADRTGPLWRLLERGLSGKDKRMFTYWLQAPDGCAVDDRAAWRAANPASWISDKFLAEQLRAVPEPVFRRLHLNQWVDAAGATGAFPRESWEECAGTPIIDPDLPSVIAVDAASRRDTTALALVQRKLDGTHHVKTWHFEADRALGYFDYSELEDLVRDLCASFTVTRLAFDPFQMVRTQQILAAEGLPAETMPQNDSRMVPACALMYDLVMERRVVHDNNPELSSHVLNAGIRETARGWRFEKRKSSGPIDGLIAVTMACQLAEWESQLGGPSVFVV